MLEIMKIINKFENNWPFETISNIIQKLQANEGFIWKFQVNS